MKEALLSVLSDAAVMEEMKRAAIPEAGLESAHGGAAGAQQLDALLERSAGAVSAGNSYTRSEAIILLRGRPVLLIQDGRWEMPQSREVASWIGKPEPGNTLLPRIPSVGRVEILDFATDYVGTGWMLAEDLMLTNRHVAELFGVRTGSSFGFRRSPAGAQYQVRVDFRREHGRSTVAQVGIRDVVFIEEPGQANPDMAIIRLRADQGTLPPPIDLDDHPLTFDPNDRATLAVVGYPAADSRNDAFAMREIFGDIYNVKRLSPGRIMGIAPNGRILEHDCTTLGGNSGSPVINLKTGKVCGLHFAGSYRERNFAVTAAWIKSRLKALSSTSTFLGTASGAAAPEVGAGSVELVRSAEELEGREGYSEVFLGDDADLEVPLPEIGADFADRIAPVTGATDGVLRYTHFSIMMRSDRRMPFFTACNIDGNTLFNFARGVDRWFREPRLAREHQIGEDLYRSNPLDRGHLVRRLDPVWGETRKEAKQAELDTFALTNCTPQHSSLNQRTWLALEDYVLGNADNHALKVSVFTGPVLSDGDPEYRGVRIPREFWKVVVMVNAQTGRLSATGYLLSQADSLTDIEFLFGEFRTYQVSLAVIEGKTGLAFNLGAYDPLGSTEGLPYRELRRTADAIL